MKREGKFRVKALDSNGVRDRLSYLGSASSDIAFLGMASVSSVKGRSVSDSERLAKSSSWVGFGQYNSLGGLKFLETSPSGEFPKVEHRQVDVLVHVGRGSMTLSSVFSRESENSEDKLLSDGIRMDFTCEEDLISLVDEVLMGLPVSYRQKDGVTFMEVLFCQKGRNMENSESGGVIPLKGYAFLPVSDVTLRDTELLALLGVPRYFKCRGVVDGKLMLTFAGGFNKKGS